jgi:hypothetical protein
VSQEIKITRSFSAKVNLGNYENVDISCSAEMITTQEDIFSTSAMLQDFCRGQVREEVDAIKRRKGGANA